MEDDYMSDDKKVDTEQPDKKTDVEPETKDEKPEDKTPDGDESKGQDIDNKANDYEAKLAVWQERAKKAEATLAKQAFKERQANREEKPDDLDDTPDTEQPLTRQELNEAISQAEQRSEKRIMETQAINLASQLTGSDAEKKLVMEIYKDTKFPNHYSWQEQVQAAVAIANSDRLIGERDEAVRALKNKDNVSSQTPDTYHDKPDSKAEPKQPADKKAVLQKKGFTYNKNTKMFEKELPGGYKMIHNPDTGENRRVKSQ